MSYDIGTDIWHIGSHVVPMSTDIGTDMSVGVCILWGRLAMSVDIGTDIGHIGAHIVPMSTDIGNRHFDGSLLGPGTRARGPRALFLITIVVQPLYSRTLPLLLSTVPLFLSTIP